uniref:DUF4774 domain-containing protein n=1 Tax=Anopheles maculatus TaxID=74869 RepID=A0A182T095_9DIPT
MGILLAAARDDSRGLYFISLLLLLLLTGTEEVRGHVSESSSSNSVRTVMDLMEVMLNRNILDMLKNGGFDFREPTRIFLPPKFYSIVPLDPGHMSPDQILTLEQRTGLTGPENPTVPLPASVAFGGNADQQRQQPDGAVAGDKPRVVILTLEQRTGLTGPENPTVPLPASVAFGGNADQQRHQPDGAVVGDKPREVLSVADNGGGSRINLISYSDGKVTTAGGGGRRPAVTNKGSETLEKNVATNGLVGAVVPAMVRTNFQERINGKEMTPANEQRWQPSLTTSITDQTVSQNVGRTLPTSGRVGGIGSDGR